MEDKIQKYKSPLKDMDKELHDVKKKTSRNGEREKREFETLESTSYTCTSSQPGKECFKWL